LASIENPICAFGTAVGGEEITLSHWLGEEAPMRG
jgi:hypothetical protein